MQKVLFIICCLAFFSCTKNDELHYPAQKHGLNIWLGTNMTPADSLTYNFAYVLTGKDSVVFHYRIAGYPLDHDTQFELEAVSGDTNLVHYSLGKYTIKAGQYEGTGAIYIEKPAGYNEFTGSTGKITFRLKASDLFESGVNELSTLQVAFKNYVARPDNWDAATAPYRPMNIYFGAYSNVKYAFIIKTTGMVDFKVYLSNAASPDLEPNTITATHATALKMECKVALQEYNEQYGILYDENNIQVVFP
ncbi:hypothetical protein HNQ91_002568 [Filimonas zeae]|uniref:DUF4843 domain-containing protein n=1 Tax=Filimonas zeae TaxID=1737353 RepID=A0A917IUE5_9BACT|nr:DUF4843 domain-containing protein [Filimonas zeae]MDR6339517.1 hypothetical protein [Filimonas zeae]GGH63250.1 hypothetical protein GCM10011379_13940 [Filimonas zeae]